MYFKILKKRKKNHKRKNTFYMTLYPNKYFYDKENFFKKKYNICNFLLSDETHLNLSMKKTISLCKNY